MSATPIITPAPETALEVDKVAAPVSAADIIAKTEPFKGLSDAIIKAIAENSDERRYGPGQTVFSLGQYDGADFFIVVSGKMRISAIDSDSGAVFVEDAGPGAVFALEFTYAVDGEHVFQRLAVTAEQALSVVAVDAEALRALAGQRPSLMRKLADYFASELAAQRFSTVAAESAPEQRVFAQLLKRVERDELSGLWRVPRMPKHRELADAADVEENIAAAAVAALIQKDVAQRDYPGLIIKDMARLNELAG